jgi:hypothetical protein
MLKRLLTVNISIWEFMYKFPLVLFVIMPVCMGGFFWIGMQIDTALNIHFLKFIFPFIGTFVGIFFAGLLIQAGHKQKTPAAAEEPAKPYSDSLVTRRSETADAAFQPKPSIPRAGFATPNFLQGGK